MAPEKPGDQGLVWIFRRAHNPEIPGSKGPWGIGSQVPDTSRPRYSFSQGWCKVHLPCNPSEGVAVASLDRMRKLYRQKGLQLSRDLGGLMREELHDNFSSLILVGSLARGDHVPAFSGLNLFLIVQDPRRVNHARIRRTIASLADKYPMYLSKHTRRGSLVVVGLTSRAALTLPRSGGTPGLLDTLTRHELRTSGITIAGEDLLAAVPEEPLAPEDLRQMHARYRVGLGDLEAESHVGRMSLIKAIFNMGRACVLLRGPYVVNRSDIVREFKARWPDLAGPLRQAEALRSTWDLVAEAPRVFWSLKADAQRFARTTAPLMEKG